MKIKVDRTGRKFENVTEVVDGKVLTHSVKNLVDAVESDNYTETDPVRMAAADDAVNADKHWEETVTELKDKAEDAKATPENVGTGKKIIKNMYTTIGAETEELDESYQQMHLILNEDIEDTTKKV